MTPLAPGSWQADALIVGLMLVVLILFRWLGA